MSSPPNPEFDPVSFHPTSQPEPPPPPLPTSGENPPWSGWDVLKIVALTLVSIFVFLFLIAMAARRLLFPHTPFVEVAAYPVVTVLAQLLAYLVVLAFMFFLAARPPQYNFLSALRWNWRPNWAAYLAGGVALSLGLQFFAHFLPMPKSLPMDRFFRTAADAWMLALFGVTFAPLVEELFFRGFLYPVLARRMGTIAAVILTSLGFCLIHVEQLGHAWAPVLVIFLVGLTLTITRAVTKSVSAGVLIHAAYNGTLSFLMFVATGGFRHLERLSQ